jgi:hypothetical protein
MAQVPVAPAEDGLWWDAADDLAEMVRRAADLAED